MDPLCPGVFQYEEEGIGYKWLEAGVEHGIKILRWRLFPWREKQLFKFELGVEYPVTFAQENGDKIRPCLPGESFPSDRGSIPILVQRYIRKEGVEYAYHDRVYQVGYLWVKYAGSDVWVPVKISRSAGDKLLRTMSQCTKEPHGKGKAYAIWIGVTIGGAWCGYEEAKVLPEAVPALKPRTSDVDEPPIGV